MSEPRCDPHSNVREGVHPLGREDGPRLLEVWEASVRATHHFLSEDDIHFLKPLVLDGLLQLPALLGVRDADGKVLGFVGVAEGKVEALFLHPSWHGRGLGRRLLCHAVEVLGARGVEVNEQNTSAVEFYRHMRFTVCGRSELDGQGRPFPLLHMELRRAGE